MDYFARAAPSEYCTELLHLSLGTFDFGVVGFVDDKITSFSVLPRLCIAI